MGAGAAFGAAILVAFVTIWRRVLLGRAVMVGGDVLYCCPPWNGSPGAHPATNALVADPVDQFLPWQKLVAGAFSTGHLPLWNTLAMSGSPLLANDQSAPFSPFTWVALIVGGAQGYSVAMLLKLWVAGIGMLIFARLLGARPLAAAVAAVSYATCSFMVVWLGWPHAAVAALLPWVFAAMEWYLRRPSLLAVAAVSATVCLQFLAGHAETSLHLGAGAAVYAVIRCLTGGPGGLGRLVGLVAGAGLGAAAAAVQLIPFADVLRQSSLVADRQGAVLGLAHLPASTLESWLVPNLHGNPAIDQRLGWLPNYNEATGFAGVGALVLAVVGTLHGWGRVHSAVAGLLGIGLFAVGTIYGVITPLTGRLPGLSVTYNARMLVLVGFVVAALAGLGMEALLSRPRQRTRGGRLALAAGLGGLGSTALLAVTFARLRVRVEDMVPAVTALPHGRAAFWVLVAGTSLVAALGLVVGGWLRGGGLAPAALAALVLIEAALFAGPYQPQVPQSEVPPSSTAIVWLQHHAGGTRVAATGLTLLPETASLYGISDIRGYDVIRPPRVRDYWSRADPAFHDEVLITELERPGVNWLAAAGVGYVMTPGDQPLPGTDAVFRGDGVTIGKVPDTRPFAFAARTTVCAPGLDRAGNLMTGALSQGQVVIEGSRCPTGSDAGVRVLSQTPGNVQLDAVAAHPTVVVVLQTYTSDWKASVDGRPASVMPADILFQGVPVPAGHHRVSLTYEPRSVSAGAAISIVAMIAIVGLGVAGVRHRRRYRWIRPASRAAP
jgi:hypothetical protein